MRTLSQHLRVVLRGAVQGVGFRPFVYRLATGLGLSGWVTNSAQGVVIEVEGGRSHLDQFLLRLDLDKPPQTVIQSLESCFLEPIGYSAFEIRASSAGPKTAIILPDLAVCAECLAELVDPSNRRYRYPFITCTHCGPRFSIVTALPYDRHNTTMQAFPLCGRCQTEYDNPLDRRFHAQPNACPDCGPQLAFWGRGGEELACRDAALQMAADAIRAGQIVAVKGLGGFHLMVDAGNASALKRLRQVKHRASKPLALMAPSLAWVKAHCVLSELEEQVLRSPAAPIVLLQQGSLHPPQMRPHAAVAPDHPDWGVLLPYTPLHHLLMADLGIPVVATSGNRAGEPLCTDEQAALQHLEGLADGFLVHDRPIAHGVDDSIVRVIAGQAQVLRRARGYAPWPIQLRGEGAHSEAWSSLVAVGAQQKATIAFRVNQQGFVSQHLGDLDTVAAVEQLQEAIADAQAMYALQPVAIACDLHPDYQSTQVAYAWAQRSQIPVVPVQHHYAHVLSCMAEHDLDGTGLGIAWDGTGYGVDGTLWGGEFLRITPTAFQRVAHLRQFGLPGGECAIKQPKRAAIGLLYEFLGEELFERRSLAPLRSFSEQQQRILRTMLRQSVNTPITSSVGRLFDAIASLCGLCQEADYEGQAALRLEFAIGSVQTDASYPVDLREAHNDAAPVVVDWATLVQALLQELESGESIGILSAKVHNTLVEMIVAIALRLQEPRVMLTGGCFQNKYLTERAIQRLRQEGFCPYWHQRIPPNDGGIALGQLVAASRHHLRGNRRCV